MSNPKMKIFNPDDLNIPIEMIEVYLPSIPYDKAVELLEHNDNNRPVKKSMVKRYARMMCERRWHFNGEPIIQDTEKGLMSGQHRLLAYKKAYDDYKASKEASEDPEKKRTAEQHEEQFPFGPPLFPCLIIDGAFESVADTIDTAQARKGGDVFYRNGEFADAENDSQRVKLCKTLAGAVRLVWLRSLGKEVKSAPKFEIPDQVDFLEQNPDLRAIVEHVVNEEGIGADGRRISAFVPLATMAGFAYLLATSTSKYEEAGVYNVSKDNWDKAEEFVTLFANGTGYDKDSPIKRLRDFWIKLSKDLNSRDRDIHINGPLVLAMTAFMEGEDVKSQNHFKVKPEECPRLGGFDVSTDAFADDPEEDDSPKDPTPKKEVSGGNDSEAAPAKKAAKKSAPKKKTAKKAAKKKAPKKKTTKKAE